MSNSESYEQVSVSSDGVTVDKRFEEDEFPVPAIAFEIQSSRSETVEITLVDSVPEGVAVEDLGFHPEYGSEYWTIDDEEITFEREIESNSEYTTVYGIRATGTDNVEQFLTEPSVEKVDPPLDTGDDVVDGEGSDVVRDVIAGESDSVPGLDEGEDEDIETLDLKDPNAPEEERQTASTRKASDGDSAESGEAAGADGGAVAESVDASSLCGALAQEIRNGNVSEDDVKLLRKAFDVVDSGGGSGGGAVDARIERLQTDIADLRAYTDALEEFLNENGTGEELIEDVRDDVESFQSKLESFESELDTFESDLNQVEETAGSYEEEIEGLETTVTEVEEEVDDVLANITTVENDLDELQSDVETVQNDIDDLDDQLGDVDEVEDRIETINEEIEELKEWREQLSSVIGGS